MRICLCGHDAAEHHLDRRTVECRGVVTVVFCNHEASRECDCTTYEPVLTGVAR